MCVVYEAVRHQALCRNIVIHHAAKGGKLSTYQFSMTSHSFGNGRHFVSNLLM